MWKRWSINYLLVKNCLYVKEHSGRCIHWITCKPHNSTSVNTLIGFSNFQIRGDQTIIVRLGWSA